MYVQMLKIICFSQFTTIHIFQQQGPMVGHWKGPDFAYLLDDFN